MRARTLAWTTILGALAAAALVSWWPDGQTRPAHSPAQSSVPANTTPRDEIDNPMRDAPDRTTDEWDMQTGRTIRGTVTVVRTRRRGPLATIRIEPGSPLTTLTSTDGSYELGPVPTTGLVSMSATAAGYMRALRNDVDLGTPGDLRVHFRLQPGESIAGRVMDRDGTPVGGARLEAWPQDSELPPHIAYSRADGAFTITGLQEQRLHRILVVASDRRRLQVPHIRAGQDGLELTLLPQALIEVRAHAPSGELVREFDVGLRRHRTPDEAAATTRQVDGVLDRRARLQPGQDHFTLTGAPSGTYVVQVNADEWAKTSSSPFTIADDTQRVVVDVRLSAGATLRGVVVDARFEPLGDAIVSTQQGDVSSETPLDRLTATAVSTAPDGSFAMRRLAHGRYQLWITHPDACPKIVDDINLERVTTRNLGRIQLIDGATITGTARSDGTSETTVRIVLTAVVDGRRDQVPANPLRFEATTDEHGRFSLPYRIPPGEYDLRATVPGVAAGDGKGDVPSQHASRRIRVMPDQRVLELQLEWNSG